MVRFHGTGGLLTLLCVVGLDFTARPRIASEHERGPTVGEGRQRGRRAPVPSMERQIPEPDEWVDHGVLFEAGPPGAWDHILWGGFALTAVGVADGHHLYYQGSDLYREDLDPTVCNRAVGLAVGDESMSFRKHGEAPVLTWAPNRTCEEGAAAGAATLGPDGTILMYYGANTSTGPTTVSADVRLAGSPDGHSFAERGVVLGHEDPGVWGHGDELFPISAFNHEDAWYLLYVPNGTPGERQLGIAWGPSPETLTRTAPVLDPSGHPIRVWGPAGYGRVAPDRFALFLKDGPDADIEVRILDIQDPTVASEPVRTYAFEDVHQATVILDHERGLWLMFYRAEARYGLKTAPARAERSGRTAPGVH